MKTVTRSRYTCPECKDVSSTLFRPQKGKMVPFCKCGSVKEETLIEEADVNISMIHTPPTPEIRAFRTEYNEFLTSPETQKKLNTGEFTANHTDTAASTRND